MNDRVRRHNLLVPFVGALIAHGRRSAVVVIVVATIDGFSVPFCVPVVAPPGAFRRRTLLSGRRRRLTVTVTRQTVTLHVRSATAKTMATPTTTTTMRTDRRRKRTANGRAVCVELATVKGDGGNV
jgi:hypothetical protein